MLPVAELGAIPALGAGQVNQGRLSALRQQEVEIVQPDPPIIDRLDGLGNAQANWNIVGVNLQILPSDPTKPGIVWIQAKYLQRPPALDECLFAPTFSANRRGLLIHPRDAFRAGIEKMPGVRTMVGAVAPNGVEGKIAF